MKTRMVILAVAFLLAVSAMPIAAHHDILAIFDPGKELTVSGNVVQITWLNPHVLLFVDVTGADGKIVTWQVELAPPNVLSRKGFQKDTVPVSSSVTLRMWPHVMDRIWPPFECWHFQMARNSTPRMLWVGSEFPERFNMRDSISKFIGIATLSTAFFSGPQLGHHSVAGMYDSDKSMIMTGTVIEVTWVNPHTWLSMEVKGADGKIATWKVEMANPNSLFRTGFRKETVPVSSTITVQVWPARNGSLHATGRILTLQDGRQFDVHDSFADFLPTKQEVQQR